MTLICGHDNAAWYAVTTKSRQEKVVATMLEYLNVVHFLPLICEERRWSDRKQQIEAPLFRGYVFVRMAPSAEALVRVLKVPGVVDFVRSRTGPLAIPNHEIADVQAFLAHGVKCSPHTFLRAGDRVRVVRGALTGMEGAFIRHGSKSQLVISIQMIQRSIAVSVLERDVEHVSNFSHPRESLADLAAS